MAHRRPKTAPRALQDVPRPSKSAPRAPRSAPRRPKRAPRRPKSAPRRLKRSPRSPQESLRRPNIAIFLWLLRDLGLLALLGSRRPKTAKRASQIAPRRAKRHPRGPQDGSGGPRDGPRGPQQRSRDLVHSSRSNPLPLLFSCSVPRGYGKAPHPDARHLGQTPRPAGRGSALVSITLQAHVRAGRAGIAWGLDWRSRRPGGPTTAPRRSGAAPTAHRRLRAAQDAPRSGPGRSRDAQ